MLWQQERAASHGGVEDVLCSKTRMKILKVLVSSISSQWTPSEIAKSVGVNYVNAAKHLEVLEAEGIVQHINFGKRTRYYKFNETSSKANVLRDLIKTF